MNARQGVGVVLVAIPCVSLVSASFIAMGFWIALIVWVIASIFTAMIVKGMDLVQRDAS